MNPDHAEAIYDILIEVCGASADEDSRLSFVTHHTDSFHREGEWRFQGTLGFGGKFWRQRDRWYVNCYGEDETPERLETIKQANRRLQMLYDGVVGREIICPECGRVRVKCDTFEGGQGVSGDCPECDLRLYFA
jgi:hypothetical protein